MTQAYDEAYTQAVKQGRSNAWYPLENAVAGRLALQWLSPGRQARSRDITGALQVLRDFADKLAGSSTDLWELALSADVRLLEAAARRALPAAERAEIAGAYHQSAVRAGSPREVASTTGQIAFLRTVAQASRQAPVRTLAAALGHLLDELTAPR
jgi:hypothetical protein